MHAIFIQLEFSDDVNALKSREPSHLYYPSNITSLILTLKGQFIKMISSIYAGNFGFI